MDALIAVAAIVGTLVVGGIIYLYRETISYVLGGALGCGAFAAIAASVATVAGVESLDIGAIGIIGAVLGGVSLLFDRKNSASSAAVKKKSQDEAKRIAEVEAKRKAEANAKHKAIAEAKRKAEANAKHKAIAEAKLKAKVESENKVKIQDSVSEAIRFASDAAIVNARISDLQYASETERAAAKAIEDAQFDGDREARKRASATALEATRIAGIENAAQTSLDLAIQAATLCMQVSPEERPKIIAEARIATIRAAISTDRRRSKSKSISKAINEIESTRTQAIEDARKLATVSKGARIVTHVEENIIERATEEARLVATKAIIEKSSDYRNDVPHIVAIEAMLSIAVPDMIEAAIEVAEKDQLPISWPSQTRALRPDELIIDALGRSIPNQIRIASTVTKKIISPRIMNLPIQGYRRLPKLESPAGYVYVIKEMEFSKLYKIGRTNDLATRSSFVDLKTPGKTQVIAILQADNDKALESRLHKKFARVRKEGEWFDLTDDQVREIREM